MGEGMAASPVSGPVLGMRNAGDHFAASSERAASGGRLDLWGGDEFSFNDLLDLVNPLQHIPIVSNLYRSATGDQIGAVARIFGGAVLGGPIGAVSELLLVKGFTPAILDTLAPYVSAERVSVPINVNTAPAELLMSLGPGIDESAAELVIRMRRTQPFQDPDAFRSHPALEGRLFDELEISTASEYFVLESRVGGGRLERRARSLLARSLPPSRFVLGRRLQGQHDG